MKYLVHIFSYKKHLAHVPLQIHMHVLHRRFNVRQPQQKWVNNLAWQAPKDTVPVLNWPWTCQQRCQCFDSLIDWCSERSAKLHRHQTIIKALRCSVNILLYIIVELWRSIRKYMKNSHTEYMKWGCESSKMLYWRMMKVSHMHFILCWLKPYEHWNLSHQKNLALWISLTFPLYGKTVILLFC